MRLFLLFITLSGCDLVSENSHEDTGERHGMPDVLECSDTPTTLASGELSALGFSAEEVLAVMAGPTEATGAYTADDSAEAVTVTIAAAGDAVFHAREPIEDTGGPEDTGPQMGEPDEDGCQDWVELPVSLSFATDDGAFAETVAATVLAADLTNLSVAADLDWTALTGSYTITEIDPAEWDVVALSVSATWIEGTFGGQVDISASRELSDTMGEGYIGPILRW